MLIPTNKLKLFGIALASAVLWLGGGRAQLATSQATANGGLPPGLIRQGGVVMMQPIGDSEEVSAGGDGFGSERRDATFRVLSPADHDLFTRSIALADRGNWAAARELASKGGDANARRIIEWGYVLDKNSGASFAEIANFLQNYPDWPARDTLFVRAEQAVPVAIDPHALIAWFGSRAPSTGIGSVRLGEALIATGSSARGQDLIRDAWINDNFEPDQEVYVIARHGELLTPEVDRQRVERLLFRDHLGAARRELPRLSPDSRRLAEVRLALRERSSLGQREIAGLPPALRYDPGLLCDEMQLFRERGDYAAIPALLAHIPATQFARWSPSRWWSEINEDARDALRAGSFRDAYRIVTAAALPRDASEYPDAEFLAGWIALRRLGDPAAAQLHFENLVGLSTHPVVRSRAYYWLARAMEAAGKAAAALEEYRLAAADAPTFYGQLALARLESSPVLHLDETAADVEPARNVYERDDLIPVIRVVADLGLEAPLREFAARDAELHPEAAHLKLLAEDVVRMGYNDIAVRIMKVASYEGIRFFEYSHPVIALTHTVGTAIPPEDALVLAIIRQETEFDPAAISRAGARGLMQVMPDAARQTAEKAGLSYRPEYLTSDPAYDVELGSAQLAHDLSVWDGSYVMATAAYNAGLGNVHKWIVAFGDPRDPRIDPIDWIEEIPFSETRNYVQRVLENVGVYRDRLAGRNLPLQILTDLRRSYASSLPRQTAPPASTPGAATPVSGSLSAPGQERR